MYELFYEFWACSRHPQLRIGLASGLTQICFAPIPVLMTDPYSSIIPVRSILCTFSQKCREVALTPEVSTRGRWWYVDQSGDDTCHFYHMAWWQGLKLKSTNQWLTRVICATYAYLRISIWESKNMRFDHRRICSYSERWAASLEVDSRLLTINRLLRIFFLKLTNCRQSLGFFLESTVGQVSKKT
jgi:hypothetical protein